MTKLLLERVSDGAIVPTKATEFSAGYDIYADITGRRIKVYGSNNDSWEYPTLDGSVVIFAGCRALIPTGWKMQCPEDHCIKYYPRSGNALKYGIQLANGTGIVDADYPDECMVILHNTSKEPFAITHGDRIAQLMLEKLVDTELEVVTSLPTLESSRKGGFGHTGTN